MGVTRSCMGVTLPSLARAYAPRRCAAARIAFAPMTRDEWIKRFAELARVPAPTAQEVEALLALAGIAAHASERTAAPLACWIAGRSQLPAAQLCDLAGDVREGEPEGR
jgi:Domain of unknown function (DUF6457)